MTYFIAVPYIIIVLICVLIVHSAYSDKPVFKKRCKKCGEKDRNWVTKYSFTKYKTYWAHECEGEIK